MEDLLKSIDSYLSAQPWWAIALVSALLMLVLSRKFGASSNSGINSAANLTEQLRSGNHSIKVIANSLAAGTKLESSELSFDSDDAQKLHALIRAGDKINAIKFVREKKNLQLIEAKNIVEAMSNLR